MQEWIDEVEKILRKITANDNKVFSFMRYTFFQRHFMQEAFKFGIMYDALDNEDISKLNTILIHCDVGIEQYVNSSIGQWNSDQIQQQEALNNFEFEKEELGMYKKHLKAILNKLNR